MSRLLRSLGLLCARRPRVVVAAWVLILLAVGAGVAAFGRQTTNDITLPGTGFQASSDLLREEFPAAAERLEPGRLPR
jgi:RND superfamily putative drug exporter